MVSTINSDPLLHFVLVVAGLFSGLCILLLLTATGFRLRSEREVRKQAQIRKKWRAYLSQCIAENSVEHIPLPKLKRRERMRFIEYWCLVHSYVRGSGDTVMNELAAKLNIMDWITPLLKVPILRYRIAAMTALGYYGQSTDKQLKLIEKELSHPNRLVAITALRSLLTIDASRGIKALRGILGEKLWSESRVLSALREAPMERVLPCLQQGMRELPRRTALKCFRLAEQLRGYTDREEALSLLERFPNDTAVIAQFLKLANVPSLLVHATRFLFHEDPEIRALVIKAIGRLGNATYMNRLIDRLEDEDAWVRYDAAATLILMPDITETMIQEALAGRPQTSGTELVETLLGSNRALIEGAL